MKANTDQSQYQGQVDPQEDVEYIKKILFKALNNWHYITLCVLFALTVAFFVNKFSAPVYSMSTSVLIKEPEGFANSPVSELLYGTEGFGGSSTNLENESILLKTLDLLEETLRDLQMQVSYYKEDNLKKIELYKSSPVKLVVDKYSRVIPYSLPIQCVINDDQSYSLITNEESLEDNLMAFVGKESTEKTFSFGNRSFPFGEFVMVDGFRFKVELDPLYLVTNKERISLVIHDYEKLAESYKGKLEIEAFSQGSTILKVSIEENNPKKGIDFLNQHLQNYITNGLEEKTNIATNTIEFIDNQLYMIQDSLNFIEGRMEDFKVSNATVDLSVEGNQLYSNIQEIEKQRSVLEMNMKYLENIKNYISQGNQLENTAIPSTFGITDPTLNGLIQQMVTIQLDLRIMESKMSSKSPLIKMSQQKISILKDNIIESISNLQQGNQLLIDNLSRKLASLSYSLKSLPSAERKRINIQRTYDLRESLYLFLMEKRTEAGISKASSTVDLKLVDAATINGSGPIKPRKTLNYAIALFMGLLIPFGFIYVTDLFNDKIQSKEELLGLTSLPFLGMISHSKMKGAFIASQNPRSAVAESFRSLRSSLRYMTDNDKTGKIYLVTSSISGEGKTFCANNLAYIFSNFGKKTVLINTDMRKPNLYDDIGVKMDYGLSHYLAGIRPKTDIIKRTTQENLYVITAGNTPPNPSELLLGEKINQLIGELKEEFDYIILDTPPVGIISDAQELIKKADVNIVVVRQNYTIKSLVTNINYLNQRKQAKNMAIILNDVNLEKLNYGYGYTGYAYYFEEGKKKKS